MSFRRSRTQILYRYSPGAIFDHDRLGICKVTDVVMGKIDLNLDSVQAAIRNYLLQWRDFGYELFPDPESEWNEYIVGMPLKVNFEPFPTILKCNKCGNIADLNKLTSISLKKDTVCLNCGSGRYHQLPYLVIHECGRMVPVHIPACPNHGKDKMSFVDTGRFVTSYWKCDLCDYRRGMPRYTCKCLYSKSPAEDPNKANEKYLRTNDTSVHYAHTINFVNLPYDQYNKLKLEDYSAGLMFAKLAGLITENISGLIDKRNQIKQKTLSQGSSLALLEELRSKYPGDQKIQELLQLEKLNQSIPGQEEIETISKHLPEYVKTQASQGLIEYVSIRDTLHVIDQAEAVRSIEARNDPDAKLDFSAAIDFSKTKLGIGSLVCVTDFPIAMASIGYSRGGKMPGSTILNPFKPETDALEGKVPIYTVASNTEAIMVQLDPLRVIDWLSQNNIVQASGAVDEFSAWISIKKMLPGLSNFKSLLSKPREFSLAEISVVSLLHTISHLLMNQIEWSGFDPESIGEYLIPEALAIVIHTNSFSSFNIGGMVTLYEQRLNSWLKSGYYSAFNCTYNPICDDEGGSCAGCLHRQYNCSLFNHFLSRAFLQGGISYEPNTKVRNGYWISD